MAHPGPYRWAQKGDINAFFGLMLDNLAGLILMVNGFIVTSLLWAWAVVAMIDRHLRTAAVVLALAGGLTLFGVIHSPGATNRIFLPFGPDSIAGVSLSNFVLRPEERPAVLEFASGYFASALLLGLWDRLQALGFRR